ncbi:MAG TPA: DnaJ domain-containing protein, partial [Tissierellaceae bacterium]|nr:DnaJ domain-containing protein [Tissierellaceae bacterium]
MEFKDYYKILGIDKNASDAEIKRAYRDLAKKYHPDLHPNDKNAQAKFQEINEAYQVLGDKE